MATYDSIAEQYHKRVVNLFSVYVRQYTFFNLIGGFSSSSVLDLACGDGFYTRKLKSNENYVVGVDISDKVIEFARREELKNPLGIEYIVRDVLELSVISRFQLVVAVQLLHYAQSKDQLLRMCQNIYNNLDVGGRFVTVNGNFDLSAAECQKTEKYGIPKTEFSGPLEEGIPITVIFTTTDGRQASFDIYYFSRHTYIRAFQSAGFREVRWHKPLVSPEGIQKFGEAFWQDALDYPVDWFIECVK